MNILQAHKYYFPRDGASRYMVELSNSLQQLKHTVVPFTVAMPQTLSSPYSRFFVRDMDIQDPAALSWSQKIRFGAKIIYSLEAKQKIHSLLADTQIDVAHIHNIYHHISPSILGALKQRKIPIVMTLHDYKLVSPNYALFHHGQIHEEDASGWYTSCVKNKCVKDSRSASALSTLEMILHHKFFRFYERYVDRFIAPSQFMIDLCVRHSWPREKFVHLPNPTNTDREFLSEEGKYVTYIGRLSEEKGLSVLLDAAKRTPAIPYRLVGEGPQKKYLKQKIQSQNIKNVELIGFQSGAKLEQEFSKARLLVLPAVWYENNPLSVLEAKARGRVVVASSIGGLSEMLPRELLVPPQDSTTLAKTLEKWYSASISEREKMGKKLQKDVQKKNNSNEHVQKVLQVYHDVIKDKR